MSLDVILKSEGIVFVRNPRLYQHIGDGYHEEIIADTLNGEVVGIEEDYFELKGFTYKGVDEPVYIARIIGGGL